MNVYKFDIKKRNSNTSQKVNDTQTNINNNDTDAISDNSTPMDIHCDNHNQDSKYYLSCSNSSTSSKHTGRNLLYEYNFTKIIWIFVGILLLCILSIILLWSLLFTCYFCVNFYYYYISTNNFIIGMNNFTTGNNDENQLPFPNE